MLTQKSITAKLESVVTEFVNDLGWGIVTVGEVMQVALPVIGPFHRGSDLQGTIGKKSASAKIYGGQECKQ